MRAGGARPRLVLYSRADCELCEHMLLALQSLAQAPSWDIQVFDIDTDVGLRARYGHKVPVLLLDGQLVCHGQFDPSELRKALAARA